MNLAEKMQRLDLEEALNFTVKCYTCEVAPGWSHEHTRDVFFYSGMTEAEYDEWCDSVPEISG